MDGKKAKAWPTEKRVRVTIFCALGAYLASFALLVVLFDRLHLTVPEDSPLLTATDPGPLRVSAAHVASAHSAACMAFAITTLLSYNVWGWSTHPAKKQVAICVWAVNVVSFFNYATKLAGVQSAVRTASGGAMRPLRYLEWSFTTSFLIRVVGVLTPDGPRARALVARTVLLDVVLIALGAAEQAAPRAYSLPLFGAALCVFLPVMGGQMRLYRLGAETLSTASDAEGLDSLRRTTLLTWCLFPVARLACLLGLVGPNAQEALFTVLDVASKFGFAVFLLVGTFSLLSPVKG